MAEAEYKSDAQGKYLVLTYAGERRRIPVENVGRWACDHDGLVSDCGRCWDCGIDLSRWRKPYPN